LFYLYVKTHNITGLKYLGQTSSTNPHAYKGSGVFWRRHLQKYGSDFSTQILLATDDKDELKATGEFFSRLWGVVRNRQWANLKEESGDGGWDHINNFPDLYREQRKKNMSAVGSQNKDTVAIVDQCGSKRRVPVDVFRANVGDLKGHTTGMFAAYDENGNMHYVSSSDPLFSSGVLKSNNKGKIYITDGNTYKLVHPNDGIPEGWHLGENRTRPNNNKVWVTNALGESKMVFRDKIEDGWVLGRKYTQKHPRAKTKWVNDGIRNYRIPADQKLYNGWSAGKIKG
jgi:hypothetical protein